jgi:hypothetical protein
MPQTNHNQPVSAMDLPYAEDIELAKVLGVGETSTDYPLKMDYPRIDVHVVLAACADRLRITIGHSEYVVDNSTGTDSGYIDIDTTPGALLGIAKSLAEAGLRPFNVTHYEGDGVDDFGSLSLEIDDLANFILRGIDAI